MNHRIRKLIPGILGGLGITALCVLLTGCATSPVISVRYEVSKPFSVVVASPAFIRGMWQKDAQGEANVCGYIDYQNRIIYVRYDRNDKSLPDFYVLGHEEWHLPELGGNFHP